MSISQRLLAALGTRLGRMHVRELQKATGLSEDQVQDGLQTLVRRGFVKRLGEGNVKATPDGLEWLSQGRAIKPGPQGPHVAETKGTSLRCRLWRAIRLIKKGTVAELLELAERGTEGNAEANAKEYLNALVRSGHLLRLSRKGERQRPNGTSPTRYGLAADSGPLPPQYNRHQKRVFDPNTGRSIDVA